MIGLLRGGKGGGLVGLGERRRCREFERLLSGAERLVVSGCGKKEEKRVKVGRQWM